MKWNLSEIEFPQKLWVVVGCMGEGGGDVGWGLGGCCGGGRWVFVGK